MIFLIRISYNSIDIDIDYNYNGLFNFLEILGTRNYKIFIYTYLLTEQDTFDHHAKIVLRYFMAEGVVTSQSLLIASQDVEPVQFMSELPAVVEDTEHHEEPESKTDELMKIAWRYQNMKAVDTSLAGGQSFGHFYDLTQTIDSDLLKAASIKQWHECDPRKQSDMFTNPAYCDLLACIQDTLSDGQYLLSDNPSERKILRIALHSLGSRLWLSDTEDASNHDLFKFLYCFRALLRNSYAVGVVTVPVNNFDDASSFRNVSLSS